MKTSEQRRWEDQFPEQKRRMRKGLYILPSLFTTANIAAGYYAIAHTLHGTPVDFDVAAKAIGVAVVADGLDGRIARMTSTTSDFGRELDSLADVITFGVAPAVLAWGHAKSDHIGQGIQLAAKIAGGAGQCDHFW